MVTAYRTYTERFTQADLGLIPDVPGWRFEIIDGELFVTKAPSNEHQRVCTRAASELDTWSMNTGLGYVLSTPGLIFADGDDVIPDVVWVSSERMPLLHGPDRHLHAAPELVLEVLSPGSSNQRRDLEVKLALYSRRDVPEYWSIDWQLERVLVYRRQGAALTLAATLNRDGILTSPLLPGFAGPVSRLFAGLPLSGS